MTKVTPELIPNSPNFHTTPMEELLNLDRLNVLYGSSVAEELQTHSTVKCWTFDPGPPFSLEEFLRAPLSGVQRPLSWREGEAKKL
ncbi:hypothetical protein TNCV_4424571 [Trichonephila clavipes]|nr:hypothetical protein TNCV_4424571 [Trichonephila clavipes]